MFTPCRTVLFHSPHSLSHHTTPCHLTASSDMDGSEDRVSTFSVILLIGAESKCGSFWLFCKLKEVLYFCSIGGLWEPGFAWFCQKIFTLLLNQEQQPLHRHSYPSHMPGQCGDCHASTKNKKPGIPHQGYYSWSELGNYHPVSFPSKLLVLEIFQGLHHASVFSVLPFTCFGSVDVTLH